MSNEEETTTEETTEKKSSKKSKDKGEKKPKKSKATLPSFDQPEVDYGRLICNDSKNARGMGGGVDPESREIASLAASIKEIGLLEPLVVKMKAGEDLDENERALAGLEDGDEPLDWYAIITAGARRYYAITMIRAENKKAFKTVPITQKQAGNSNDEWFRMMAENLERENLTPAEKADAFYKARTNLGITVDEIAEKLPGLSKGYIGNLITLRKKLSAEAFKAFGDGTLTFDMARAISSAGSEEKQNKALAQVTAEMEATGQAGKKKKRGSKAAAKRAAKGDTDGPPARPTIKEVKATLEELADPANNYQKGIAAALNWVLGNKKRLPSAPK